MSVDRYGQSIGAGPSRKPAIDLAALEKTSKLIQDQLAQDARLVPELRELITSANLLPVPYVNPIETPWDLYQVKKSSPVPQALFDHLQTTQTRSYLGLFPELQRAWFTIDHKLFLWDYNHGEFDSFTEQPEPITSVTLVRPKQGVFVDDIKHIMVVCTTASVLLIGIATTAHAESGDVTRQTIKLYATDMVVPTKSVAMACITGTDSGRIFMGGSDSYLYELEYASTESWFSAKVNLKNHSISFLSSFLPNIFSVTPDVKIKRIVVDNHRQCLYTVSTAQTISVYYLGTNGLDSNLIPCATLRDIPRLAHNMTPGASNLDTRNFEIVGLHVITPDEASADVHAVAVTSKGVRIYLTNKRSAYGYGYSLSNANAAQPNDLRIINVRVPPVNMVHPSEPTLWMQYGSTGPPPDARVFNITSISLSFYSRGLFVAAQSPTTSEPGQPSVLTLTFPDSPSISTLKKQPIPQPAYGIQTVAAYQRSTLIENVKNVQVPLETWAIAEIPQQFSGSSASHAPASFNELAVQFTESQRELAVLTDAGITTLIKLRPVDVVQACILQNNQNELQRLFNSFGRDQICAMFYAILAKNSFVMRESNVAEHTLRTAGRLDVGMNTRNLLLHLAEKPTMSPSQMVELSGRFHGLAIYLSRLVRPVWNAKIAKPSAQGKLTLNLPEDLLVRTRNDLQSLRDFCEGDPVLFQAPPGDHRTAGPPEEAWKTEIASTSHLKTLVAQTVEAISFVLLLHDFNLGDLASRCDQSTQQRLGNIIFADLITTAQGRDLARVLVNAVINQQINQQVNVDTISDVLQQRCGSFCSTDDVMLYKAEENVKRAADSRIPSERSQALLESLKLYSKGCKNINPEKLQSIALEYRRLRYAKGAVELPLRCAQEWDMQKAGYEYWLAGCPANDPRVEAYNVRSRCYELVLDTLHAFDELRNAAKGPIGQDVIVDDAELISQTAYRTALNSRDAIFHSALYDWLIERGSADELLEAETPFLESHLRREPVSLQKGDLLWQYYVKSGQYMQAAETLLSLAESTRFALGLERRVEYLSLAVGNAKSDPMADGGRQDNAVAFLTDLEERLEVAQVQLEILQALERESPSEPKLQQLRNGLKTVTELYEDFAEPLDLAESKLLLPHVSEHTDTQLAVSIWRYMFDKFAAASSLEEEFTVVANVVERLGRRFCPSPSAFPADYITKTLEDMSIKNRKYVPPGWAPRVLRRANMSYQDIFDQLNGMYESQVPPYHTQANVQALSSDIAIILLDWLNDATGSHSGARRADFPAGTLLRRVEVLSKEVTPSNTETKKMYDDIKNRIRQEF